MSSPRSLNDVMVKLRPKRLFVLLAISLSAVVSCCLFAKWFRATNPQPTTALRSNAAETGRPVGPSRESVVAQGSSSSPAVDAITKARVDEVFGKSPMRFEINQGQVASEVKFLARGKGYTLFLTPTEAVLSLKQRQKDRESGEIGRSNQHPSLDGRPASEAASTNGEVVRTKLVGGNQHARIEGADELPGKVNYLIGNDPTKWRTNISIYEKVKYQDVYTGVDLVYYGNQRQLEYDFVVAPQADPRAIRLEFTGAKAVRIDDDGSLVLNTASGEEIRQSKPIVYQEVNGQRKQIAGSYLVRDQKEVGFEIPDYDPSKPLVIDPTLIYSRYLGGGGIDTPVGVAADPNGDVYLAGWTESFNFPILGVVPGQGTLRGGLDAFVVKINASGTIIYSTYLGGSSTDFANAITAYTGNAYVTGTTGSTNFPTTAGAVQTVNRGNGDAFVTRLSTAGNAIEYSTYLGGNLRDDGNGIARDSSGFYVVGTTASTTLFPLLNARQGSLAGGTDAFTTRFDNNGALVYSSYLGGSGDDSGTAVAIGGPPEPFFTGSTLSSNFPTANAKQATYGGGRDAFLTKLTVSGTLSFSTYLGGADSDEGLSVAVNSSSEPCVTGATLSTNFPLKNARQLLGGSYDAFVTKYNVAGSDYNYSTYLGGSSVDVGTSVVLDTSGNAYVGGYTYSPNFPTANAFLSIPVVAGGSDAFITKLDVTGNTLLFSTYLGGRQSDGISGIATTATNGTIAVGTTYSTDFPTAGATSTSNAGSQDGFVLRISESTNPTFYAIRGRLSYANNKPVIGASVQLTGTSAKSTTTDTNGNYIFQMLSPGNYTVTPDPVIGFDPAQRSYSPLAGNDPSANFVSTKMFQISGRVKNVNGRGLSGIEVNLTGDSNISTTTNGDGDYSFQVAPTGNYTVGPHQVVFTPSATEVGWVPTNTIPFTNLMQDSSGNDFTANSPSPSISGEFTNLTQGPGGITVIVTGSGLSSKSCDVPTPTTYACANLNINGDYFVIPSSNTYAFTPTNRSFMSLPGFLANNNFAATVKQPPTTTTSAATAVTPSSASLNGSVNPNGFTTNAWFDWGTSPTLATFTSTASQSVGNGSSPVSINAGLTGLTGATTYYFRAVAANNFGTTNGSILNFTTLPTPRTLTVASTNPASGVTITVSPNDNGALGNGTTQFVRTYNNNQAVSLTAPATASGNNFQKWQKDGVDFANNTLTNVSVTMDANHTMTAVYLTPRTLTVASTNPASGVVITVSPNDNGGQGNGTTQFARTYNNNQAVSLTAPATASGNNFQKWQKDGADFANNTLTNVSVTMDANHTMTAVYLTPGPAIFVEDGSSPLALAAVDSVSFTRGPFTLTNPKNFSSDQRTRIIFFTTNLGLPQTSQPPTSTLSVQLNGISHAVESVGPYAPTGGSYIIFRLPDLVPGDYPLGIRLNGVNSANTPNLKIIASPSSPTATLQSGKPNSVEYLLFPFFDLSFLASRRNG